jgi:hypothetical protein
LEVTKKDIEQLIELRKDDTFLNHLKTIIIRDYRASGEVGRNQIKVWRQNMWNSTFYPIFYFELNPNNHLTNITAKLNPVGKTLIGILVLTLIYWIFPKNIAEFDFIDNWLNIILISVFVFIATFVFRKIYQHEKKNQLEQIFEILDIETEPIKPEKEWSIKNLLIRLFTYPFCAFLIWLNLTTAIPAGNYLIPIGTAIFIIPYLYIDLKLILKNV